MEIEIIDTPATYTVADIKPGQEFVGDNGVRYMRIVQEVSGAATAVIMEGRLKGSLAYLSRTDKHVTPCDPPAPVTFDKLKQGDLFLDKDRDICIVTDESHRHGGTLVTRLSDGWAFGVEYYQEVTPLAQVEPLKLKRK